jgi:bidirectional [NiFe] hydrogenase diaphorase subunit
VLEVRRMVLELLLARCPNSNVIRELAIEHGVERTDLVEDDRPDDNCILCGLCARVCAKIEAHAIATAGRGVDKVLASPFREPPADCIGCTACARVCPTQTIPFEREQGRVRIWNREFQLLQCPSCGKFYMTPEERDHYMRKTGLTETYFAKCEECRRADAGRKLFDVTAGMTL